MPSPTISIIVPCYNIAPYVEQCIKSILKQSHADLECIAIDDCSPDNTLSKLNELATEDRRLKIIRLEKNGGVSNARNKGLDMACGEWIMFVDGDDFLPTDAIEKLLEPLSTYPEAGLICANATHYSADGKEALCPHFKLHGSAYFNVFSSEQAFEKHQDHFNNCCFKLFRRSLIAHQRFQDTLCYGEDTLFCHQYIISNRANVYMDYEISAYCYRQIPTSCIHSATLQRRLHDLEVIITAMNALQRASGFPIPLTRKKAAEVLWLIKKFSSSKSEQIATLKQLLTSDFYHNELADILGQSTKLRHRIILSLLKRKFYSAIQWW